MTRSRPDRERAGATPVTAWARVLVFGLCSSLIAGASGCGELWGPREFPTVSVQGRAVCLGQPVTRGWLEWIPVEGTPGNFRSAPLDSDGRFSVTNAPVGRVAVRIVAPPAGLPIPGALRSFGSPLRVSLDRDSGKTPWLIDLGTGQAHP